MAHVLLDRAKVVATSMSGNTYNYTLTNTPETGFVDFTGVGDGNTTYYAAIDNAGNFEIGIGTFATSGEVLTRTDGNVILSSNNGNNNRVSWPSNSTPTVFISQPADKAVSLDNNNNVTITSTTDDGPVLNLVSNDHSDAANWTTEGKISFKADNDANEETEFASISLTTAEIADGNETGRLKLKLTNAGGSPTESYQFAYNKLFLENDNHAIRWNNTRGTSYDLELVTTTPTANRTYTLPDATGTVITTGNMNAITDIGIQQYTIQLGAGANLEFEGATGNAHETTLTVTEPTQDNTITLPDATGTVVLDTHAGNLTVNGQFIINYTNSGAWQKPIQALAPNLADGQNAQFTFGKASSSNNLVEFSAKHISDGDAGNYFSFGYHSGTVRPCVRTDGKVSIGNTHNSPGNWNQILNVNGNIEAMGTIELGHADDTTIERVSAGVVSIQSNNILTTATGATTGKAIAMAMVFG